MVNIKGRDRIIKIDYVEIIEEKVNYIEVI